MALNSSLFEMICFFTAGFLCLVGLVGLYLSILFKEKLYFFYSSYIVFILIFICSVYGKAAIWFPKPSLPHTLLILVIDVSQMISSFMFSAFLYHALVKEKVKSKTLDFSYKLYIGFIIFYVITVVLFPNFVIYNVPYFIVSRIIVVVFSLFFYYFLILELRKTYFKFLFLALSFLLLSGFFAFWDSIFNYHTNIFFGFQILCLGYILENVCFVCAFIYKYFSTNQQKIEAEIKHKLQLSVVKLEMQELTMQNIGREIHDNVGQKLTLASLYAQQLGYENKAPLIINTIESISELINQSLGELRQLSKSLTSDTIDSNTLEELLKIECERFKDLKNCKITFNAISNVHQLGYQSKSVLIRICQEFIQNSLKHSDCKNIEITLNNSLKKLSLCLQDDGKGFDVNQNKHNGIGLVNIKKRLKIIGGSYSLESQINFGTKLTIEIPF